MTLLRVFRDGAVVGWAVGLMWGHVVVAGPGPAAALALRACRLWGLWGSAGSCGAFAPAALGDFGVDWGCLHNSRYYVAEF